MWLFSRNIDLTTLYLPIWICWAILCCLPSHILQADIPLWVWVIFVLFVDVGHVWSTIFRTYLDSEEFTQHRQLLLLAPLFSFLIVVLISWISVFWFWRLLAYLALFHFIKQQYGFLALYKMKAQDFGQSKLFQDKWILYWATLYPVFYWHCAQGINFSWFVPNDFLNIRTFALNYSSSIDTGLWALNTIYWLLILAWLIEELYKNATLQLGKILWMLTTAVNWYIGIVYFNSDLAFTLTNVIAHGIPYMVLILYYQQQKAPLRNRPLRSMASIALLILPLVFVLAWLEEYCWDMLIYGERLHFFSAILAYPFDLLEQPLYQSIAIATLTIPQLTHYIIDGFIWKSNPHNPYVKQIFSSPKST